VPELSLSIPCYNEAAGVRKTVEGLAAEFAAGGIDVELVLVDNGSTDGTGDVIDRMIADGLPVTKCTVAVNRGYGLGVLVGLNAGRGTYIGAIPADGQVDPHDVVKVYRLLADARSPRLVKVRRRFRMDGFKRKVVSVVYNGVVNLVWGGLRSIDVNGSPKMFPREYLAPMNLRSTDWFLDAEILIRAKQLRLPVYELNVFAQMRSEGSSNVNSQTILEFLGNIARWRFRPPPPLEEEVLSLPTLSAPVDG
jgi:glycosyltransferase involved in cell wall biosynthesis